MQGTDKSSAHMAPRRLKISEKPAGPVSFTVQVAQARCEESAPTQLQYDRHKGGAGHLLHPFCIRQGFLHREENSCEILSEEELIFHTVLKGRVLVARPYS